MAHFFPRHAVDWRLEEPAAFRKLSLSLVEMAVLTGVALRLYRAIVLGAAGSAGWLAFGVGIAAGVLFLAGMAAAHLGNYPVHRWIWRAPAFGALTGAAEALTGLFLIALHREPLGTARASWADWPSMANTTVLTRTTAVTLFALVLAAVVQGVRVLLLRRSHRDHTLRAVHHERVAPHDG